MFGLKKKLSALVPSDKRSTLQKALTVEWDHGPRTVLLDLAEPNTDVEMGAYKAPRSAYASLPDDDDEFDSGLGEREQRESKPEAMAGRRRQAGAQEAHGPPSEDNFNSPSLLDVDSSDDLERRAQARRKAPSPRPFDPPSLFDASFAQPSFSAPAPSFERQRESQQQFRSNNPFAAPFSRADEAAALPRLYDRRPAELQRDGWMWDGAGSAGPSPTSSFGSGSSSRAVGNPFR